MAQRQVTGKQKQQLAESIRNGIRDGRLAPGTMLPTVRELSKQHNLSVSVVSQELQIFIDEGLLYTTPRVGTFVGKPISGISDFYLMVHMGDEYAGFAAKLGAGFEERIAELGASSLVLPLATAAEYDRQGDLPPLCGVFDFAYNPRSKFVWRPNYSVPFVAMAPPGAASMLQDSEHTDTVYFDDVAGGRIAANHLLRLGHKKTAFLGLHHHQRPTGFYLFSALRAEGWRQAMLGAGENCDELMFAPSEEPRNREDEARVALNVARALVAHNDITAVVAANGPATKGLLEALREANVPHERWPAVVRFDDVPDNKQFVLTSIRLPWEEAGRAAADFLWQRRNGRLTGPSQLRLIEMKIVSRITAGNGLHAYARTI